MPRNPAYLPPWVPAAAIFAERWLLSAVYLYFAWCEARELRLSWGAPAEAAEEAFVQCLRHSILLALDSAIGFSLLAGRKPEAAPRTLKEIAVPLAASFFFVSYNFLDRYFGLLPEILSRNLAPAWLRPGLPWAGLVLATLGPAIAVWGALSLGRSFGIFVSVRSVVLRGPYRFVRHPMYLGYILIFTGLALTYSCLAAFALYATHVALFAWRARLEERRLAEHSPAYREYMKGTNMLFPRIGWRL